MTNIDFAKSAEGLVPVIVQDFASGKVLMLGYMNQEAFDKTTAEKVVTFYSRSKQRLWTKGETSGHFLHVKSVHIDCDQDTILIKAQPQGAVCHTGADTCFGEKNDDNLQFISHLCDTIHARRIENAKESYTAHLFRKGINKIAQKVGEEAVEVVIEAKDSNDDLFRAEAADLLFHYLVLLEAKNIPLTEVIEVLKSRHQ